MRLSPAKSSRPALAVHWLVVLMLGVSAIAWAWHVDIPAQTGEPVQVTAAADHAHADGGDLAERCDHCCHADAHLVALPAATALPSNVPAGDDIATASVALTEPETDPPFIPPIA